MLIMLTTTSSLRGDRLESDFGETAPSRYLAVAWPVAMQQVNSPIDCVLVSLIFISENRKTFALGHTGYHDLRLQTSI